MNVFAEGIAIMPPPPNPPSNNDQATDTSMTTTQFEMNGPSNRFSIGA
jgi:hypothetical protein